MAMNTETDNEGEVAGLFDPGSGTIVINTHLDSGGGDDADD